MDDRGSTVLRLLLEAQESAVRSTHARLGDATATVAAANIAAVLQFLRDTPELPGQRPQSATPAVLGLA